MILFIPSSIIAPYRNPNLENADITVAVPGFIMRNKSMLALRHSLGISIYIHRHRCQYLHTLISCASLSLLPYRHRRSFGSRDRTHVKHACRRPRLSSSHRIASHHAACRTPRWCRRPTRMAACWPFICWTRHGAAGPFSTHAAPIARTALSSHPMPLHPPHPQPPAASAPNPRPPPPLAALCTCRRSAAREAEQVAQREVAAHHRARRRRVGLPLAAGRCGLVPFPRSPRRNIHRRRRSE